MLKLTELCWILKENSIGIWSNINLMDNSLHIEQGDKIRK